jgi:hypothetical protein
MSRLPKKVMERWTKLKHELLSAIDKMKDDMIDDAKKKDWKKKVGTLYDQFDSGLSKTLKKADDAKSDKDALKPLSEAVKTTNAYISKVKTTTASWDIDDSGIADKFTEVLKEIKRACEGETVRIAKATK